MKKTLLFTLLLLPLYSFGQLVFVSPYGGASFCRATAPEGLLSEAKKVWHPIGGIEAYRQSPKGYEIGLGYCIQDVSLRRKNTHFNLGKPMNTMYLILGTGHISESMIMGLHAQFGLSWSTKPPGKDDPDIINYAVNGKSIALKLTLGKRLGKWYCLSLQPAIRAYYIEAKGQHTAPATNYYTVETTLALHRLFNTK